MLVEIVRDTYLPLLGREKYPQLNSLVKLPRDERVPSQFSPSSPHPMLRPRVTASPRPRGHHSPPNTTACALYCLSRLLPLSPSQVRASLLPRVHLSQLGREEYCSRCPSIPLIIRAFWNAHLSRRLPSTFAPSEMLSRAVASLSRPAAHSSAELPEFRELWRYGYGLMREWNSWLI